jgi:hypothetical protein
MKLSHARKLAITISKQNGCSQHVQAKLVKSTTLIDGEENWLVDQWNYTVSDWFDGSTVETYSNGKPR